MKDLRKFIRLYQHIAISVGMIAGVGLCVLFGLVPAVKSIIAMRSEITDLSSKNSVLKTKTSVLESLDEDTYNRYLKELAYAVPTDKSLTTLFTTIDGLSQLTGVSLSDFTLTKPGSIASESAKRQTNEEKKVGTNFLPFTLTVTGTYDQIHKFMEQSIAVRRFFRIRFFDISFDKPDYIQAHMGMDAYYAPLPTNLGSATQKIDQLDESDERTISKIANMPLLGTDMTQESQAPATVQIGPPREDPFNL